VAWTLAEFSKIETDVLKKSVIDTLVLESSIMEMLPWETTGQLASGVTAIQDLPSIGWRRLNAGFEESTGTLKQKVESVSLSGGYIDTDKAIADSKNTIEDARAIQQQMALKAFAYKVNDTFINGNVVTNPLEFNGIKQRIDGIVAEGFTGQKIDCDCNGTAITDSTATINAFIDKLDELVYSIKGHQPDMLLMNGKALLTVRSVLRRANLLDTTRDAFDRRVDSYQGARLVNIGTKADQVTEIIPTTETYNLTDIYAVKFGIGDMTWGLQQAAMEVEDLGLLKDKPVYRTMLYWNIGLATVDPRSLAVLHSVDLA